MFISREHHRILWSARSGTTDNTSLLPEPISSISGFPSFHLVVQPGDPQDVRRKRKTGGRSQIAICQAWDASNIWNILWLAVFIFKGGLCCDSVSAVKTRSSTGHTSLPGHALWCGHRRTRSRLYVETQAVVWTLHPSDQPFSCAVQGLICKGVPQARKGGCTLSIPNVWPWTTR